MITKFKQIGEGQRVRFTLKNGTKFATTAMKNDRVDEAVWIEESEGCFAPIPYDQIAHVSIRTFNA